MQSRATSRWAATGGSGTGGTVDVTGAALAYTATGQGPVAVYAHGLAQSRAADARAGLFDFSPVARAGRRLVTFDARGHGRSSGRPRSDDYTWSRLAADLLALLDAVGTGTASGIGASMGTGTLLHAAVRAPHRFDRLVLTIPPTAWETRRARADGQRAGARLAEEHGIDRYVQAAAEVPPPPILADLPDLQLQPDVTVDLLPSVLRGAAASDLPAPEEIAQIAVPTLILAWPDDPGHPLSTARRLAELLPAAELRVARALDEVRRWGQVAADFVRVT